MKKGTYTDRYVGDAVRGLHYLMEPGKNEAVHHFDALNHYCRVWGKQHPLYIPLLETKMAGPREVLFTGGGNERNDCVVASFLACLRFWAGFEEELRIESLRIVTAPFIDGDPQHHYVFFEAQVGCMTIISGETTDFSEGTRSNLVMLEDVFSLLALTYDAPILRLKTDRQINLNFMYQY
jgi:hypothetical protein